MLGSKLSLKGKDLLACPFLPPDLVALHVSEAQVGLRGVPLGFQAAAFGPAGSLCPSATPAPRGAVREGLGLRPGAGAPWAQRLLLGPAHPQGARVTPFLRLLTRE